VLFEKVVVIVLWHVLRKLTWRTHDGIFTEQRGLALSKVIRGLCEEGCVLVCFRYCITCECELWEKVCILF